MDNDQTTPETETKVENIARIVNESAAQNEKTPASRSGAKRPKRGGGRPRKDGKPNRATLKLMGLESDPLENTPLGAGAPPIAGANPNPPGGMPLELPSTALKPVLQLPFSLLRARTGFEGFKLSDEAVNDCLPLLDLVLKQYLPETNSPHAPAFTLVTVLGTHLFMQYQDYRAHLASQTAKPAKVEEEKTTDPIHGFEAETIGGTMAPGGLG